MACPVNQSRPLAAAHVQRTRTPVKAPETDWRDEAACAGMDPALWGAGSEDKPSTAAQLLEGRQICATKCPVMAECLRDAFKHEEANAQRMATTRSGLSADERSRLRNKPNSPAYQPLMLTTDEHERRSRVAASEPVDSRAARMLGLTTAAYRLWRGRYFDNRTGAAQQPSAHLLNSQAEEALRMNSYASGMSDTQIAITCGTTKWTIQRWRQRRGLAMNKARVTA